MADIDIKRKDMLGQLRQADEDLYDLLVRKRSLIEELDALRSKTSKEKPNKKPRHQAFSSRMSDL